MNKFNFKRVTQMSKKGKSSITITKVVPASPNTVEQNEEGLVDLETGVIRSTKVELVKERKDIEDTDYCVIIEDPQSEEETTIRKTIGFDQVTILNTNNGLTFTLPGAYSFIKCTDKLGVPVDLPKGILAFTNFFYAMTKEEIKNYSTDDEDFGIIKMIDSTILRNQEIQGTSIYMGEVPIKENKFYTITWSYVSTSEILNADTGYGISWYDYFKAYFHYIIETIHMNYHKTDLSKKASLSLRALLTQPDVEESSDDEDVLEVPLPAMGMPYKRKRSGKNKPTSSNLIDSLKSINKKIKSNSDNEVIKV